MALLDTLGGLRTPPPLLRAPRGCGRRGWALLLGHRQPKPAGCVLRIYLVQPTRPVGHAGSPSHPTPTDPAGSPAPGSPDGLPSSRPLGSGTRTAAIDPPGSSTNRLTSTLRQDTSLRKIRLRRPFYVSFRTSVSRSGPLPPERLRLGVRLLRSWRRLLCGPGGLLRSGAGRPEGRPARDRVLLVTTGLLSGPGALLRQPVVLLRSGSGVLRREGRLLQ